MTDFTVTIEDKAQLIGISLAREAYNATLPEIQGPPDKKGVTVTLVPKPGIFPTDKAYFQFAAVGLAESYVTRYNTRLGDIDEKISALQVERAELVAMDSK